MEYFYNIIQTIAIIAHLIVLLLRLSNFKNLPIVSNLTASLIQIILVVYLTRDLANHWIVNKEWIWYLMDYLLALYFYLSYINSFKK